MAKLEETGGLFCSGIEQEVDAFTTDFGGKTVDAGCALVTSVTPVAHGLKAAKATYNGTGYNAYATKALAANQSDVYVRAYFRVNNNWTTASAGAFVEFMIIRSSGNQDMLGVGIQDNGVGGLRWYGRLKQGSWANLFTGTYGEVTKSQWYCVEARWFAGTGGANGGGQIWIDTISKGSKFDVDLHTYAISGVRIGTSVLSGTAPSAASELYFDDVKVNTAPIGLYHVTTRKNYRLDPYMMDARLWLHTT